MKGGTKVGLRRFQPASLPTWILVPWWAASLFGCRSATQDDPAPKPAPAATAVAARPPIEVDGSSTVYPISKGILDLYASRLVADVNLAFSGTGGGFKLFCRSKLTISAASRPINPTEAKLCAESGTAYVELPVAFDGVGVVVPRSATFVDYLTAAELRKIWEPRAQGTVKTWRDVRASFPDEKLELAGPGLESGTFDFFTSAVVGEAGQSRADYKASEDDEEIARFLAATRAGLGYFGLAYVARHKADLRAIAIDDERPENGEGPIGPSPQTILEGQYQPLSRPLFLYVSLKELERPEVRDFVEFYLRSARLVAPDVGAVGLPERLVDLALERLKKRQTGSAFAELSDVVGLSLEQLYTAEVDSVSENPSH